MELKDKLEKIKESILETQNKIGIYKKIEIIAVTKTHSFQTIQDCYQAGFSSIGENRVQEALDKFGSFDLMPELKKRFIGHLQSNKLKKCLNLFDTIDSVDSKPLLKKISNYGQRTNKEISVLLEVNTSKEKQKYGFLPEEIDKILSCFEEPSVLITGLMTVAPFTSDEKKLRSSFKMLRDLKEKVNNELGKNKIHELSMGMSNDYKIAIEEGSTMLRLGTLLFGQRGYIN